VEKAQKLEGVGVGMPNAPAELTAKGHTIPLQPEEQRQFQEVWGQEYSKNLDLLKKYYPDRQFPDDVYTRARDKAREVAQGQVCGADRPGRIASALARTACPRGGAGEVNDGLSTDDPRAASTASCRDCSE
jgi:hypothetical protein